MKMVPINCDPQKGKVEKLTAKLMLAYSQQKRYKAQYEDQAVKIENLRRLVWEMDRKAPPSYSLMQAYENQRYILFSLIGIEGIGQQFSQGTFERMWKIARLDDNAQNLIAEMILRADIIVPKLTKKLFSIFGYLGYRSLRYWLNLETQLHERHTGDKPVELERSVRLPAFDEAAQRYVAALNEPRRVEWRKLLVRFQDDLARVEYLRQSFTHTYEREELAQRGELNVGHCLHATSILWGQLKELLADLDRGVVDPLPRLIQVQLTFPPPGFVRPPWAHNLALPAAGSRRAQRYLGNYPSLFESQQTQDAAVPTWDAMLWIAEHYQNVAIEETPWDMLYQCQVEPNWTQDAPAIVRATGVFCELAPRRLLWIPDVTIDCREYN